ncbi:RNA-directed DNA polymerase [Comamonadaceae bacterium OH2310_COT-174]|nr:RNA-directed DNA polymerase [Comamonadaceae bacterium OH2310_COT-174]
MAFALPHPMGLNPHDDLALRAFAQHLARALLAGPWTPMAMRARLRRALGLARGDASPDWLRQLVRQLHAQPPFALPTQPRRRKAASAATGPVPGSAHVQTVADAVARCPAFRRAWSTAPAHAPWRIKGFFLPPPPPKPAAIAKLQPFVRELPPLAQVGDIAAWLELEPGQLDWLANCQDRPAPHPKLAHYRAHWLPKGQGGLPRLIEAPKARLKQIQRRILQELLAPIPLHNAAHGGVRGRSALSHAQAHAGMPVLLKFDLRDFFPSIRAARIHAIFACLGHTPAVCRVLTALVTTRTAHGVLRTAPLTAPSQSAPCGAGTGPSLAVQQAQLRQLYGQRHLPQGAPSSTLLANLAAARLDMRLAAAAAALQGRYTRYVDDLAISLPQLPRAQLLRMQRLVRRIVHEEGFVLNEAKCGLYTASQAHYLTGICINAHPNLPRAAYDQLKAILHQCVLHGPSSQNRDGHSDFRAHLQGRIAWCRSLNPARAAKLQRLFERIDWQG